MGGPGQTFLHHCLDRRRSALILAGLVAVAGLAIGAILPPSYRAEASLAVLPAPEFTVRQDAGSHQFASSALAMDQVMKAETGILGSADLLADTIAAVPGPLALYPELDPSLPKGALSRLAGVVKALLSPWRTAPPEGADLLQDAAMRRLADAVRILPAKDSNVINVTFSHKDPFTAARTLNLLLGRYAERRRALYRDPQWAVAQRESEALAAAAATAETALAQFKAAHGLAEFDAERDLLLKRRSAAAQSFSDAEAAHAEAQARTASLGRALHGLAAPATLYVEHDPDTRLQTEDAQLVALRGRLATARGQYKDDSRAVSAIIAEIKQAERERRQLAANPAPSVVRRGRAPALDPLLVDRARADADLAAATAQMNAVGASLDAIDGRLHALATMEAELSALSRKRDAADANYAAAARAAAEQRMTEAEDASRLANVRVIQKARVPVHASPAKLLTALSGLLLGPMLAACWLYAGFVLRDPEDGDGLPRLDAFGSARDAAESLV